MVERINLELLLRKYKGGGTSSYHPGMMLKVLVYAYTQRIYSSRQKRYEEQERKLAGRNSFSKTDEDATFMRMKEDRGAEKPPMHFEPSPRASSRKESSTMPWTTRSIAWRSGGSSRRG